MSRRPSRIRQLRVRFRRFLTRNEQIILQSLGVLFLALLAFACLVLWLFGEMDYTKLTTSALIPFVAALIAAYFFLIRRRAHDLIMSMTTKYLLEGNHTKLDELLGILISGDSHNVHVDPVKEFFDTLVNVSHQGSVELKRRVAEALPVLFELDFDGAAHVWDALRYDWDERWKADNRRRAIEALAFLADTDARFVVKKLTVNQKDEVYCLIAMVEVLALLVHFIGEAAASERFVQLETSARNFELPEAEIDALRELWAFHVTLLSSLPKAKGCLDQMREASNVYVQIAAARNFRCLCGTHGNCQKKKQCRGDADRSLQYMEYFLNAPAKYVRRPVAKHDSLDCLCILLGLSTAKERAKVVIWRLLRDEDDIIRMTTFDKIDRILSIDRSFGMEIVSYLCTNEANSILKERASVVAERTSESPARL